MSTTVKIYSLQPQLDVPAQSRIRFPLWLKFIYNIAQMELTTLDPLGAFYLVALDADWKLRSQNINSNGTFRQCPTITMPTAYPATATAGRIGAYSVTSRNFELQQRVCHSPSSLGHLFQPRQRHPQRDQLQAPVRHRLSLL